MKRAMLLTALCLILSSALGLSLWWYTDRVPYPRPVRTFQGLGHIHGIAISREASLLAIRETDESIRLWNWATGQLDRILEEGSQGAAIGFSPKGDAISRLGWPEDLLIWDPDRQRVRLRAHDSGCSFTLDGRYIAKVFGHGVEGTTIFEGGVRVWNTQTGEQIFSRPWTTDGRICYALSPDGKILAAASRGEVRLWEVATGNLQESLQSLHLHRNIGSLVFSPDGQFLLARDVGRVDGLHAVSFWDLANHRKRVILRDEKEGYAYIRSCAFSPDGKLLAVGGQIITWFGAPGRVKLWDLTTGKSVCTISCNSVVERVAFGPDGKTLAAVENNWPNPELVHVWDVSKLVPPTPDR